MQNRSRMLRPLSSNALCWITETWCSCQQSEEKTAIRCVKKGEVATNKKELLGDIWSRRRWSNQTKMKFDKVLALKCVFDI